MEEEDRVEEVEGEDEEVEEKVSEERGTRLCIVEGEGGEVDDRGGGGRGG